MHRFTIAHDATPFALLWLSGSNQAASAGRDLGFTVTADTGSALSHQAEGASYQSRHYLLADLGATLDVDTVLAFDHNSGALGTYTGQGAASLAAALTAPAVTLALDDGGISEVFRIGILGGVQSYRYWAVIIDDVANPDGFNELGLWFVGEPLETTELGRGLLEEPVDFSTVTFADQGASYQDRRQRALKWTLPYQALTAAQKEEVDRIADYLLTGGCFFLIRDEEDVAGTLDYVLLLEQPKASQRGASSDLWDQPVIVQTVLG